MVELKFCQNIHAFHSLTCKSSNARHGLKHGQFHQIQYWFKEECVFYYDQSFYCPKDQGHIVLSSLSVVNFHTQSMKHFQMTLASVTLWPWALDLGIFMPMEWNSGASVLSICVCVCLWQQAGMEFGMESTFYPVCLFVCLSLAKNFNLGHNFWTIRDIDFIFGMHTQPLKAFQLVPRSTRLWPWP